VIRYILLGILTRKNESHPELLGHVQRVSFCCLRVGTFAENPRGGEGRARRRFAKGRRGPCSQVLPPASATLYAHTTAQLDPVRRGCRGGGFGGKPGIGVHRSHCAVHQSSAPHRSPVICFASPSSCRAAAPCFFTVSLDRERNHEYILQIEKKG
jgi:hypothetical protein